MLFRYVLALFSILTLIDRGTCSAQQHQHQHAHGSGPSPADAPVQRPKIFLDKSPRIVAYQLGRLDNEKLLLVERADDDEKYAPVYFAILTRPGMSPQYREEALAALTKLRDSNPVQVLIEALAEVEVEDRQTRQTFEQLTEMLLDLPVKVLRERLDTLITAAGSDDPMLRSATYAAMIQAGRREVAWEQAQTSEMATLAWLRSIALVPSAEARNDLRNQVVTLVTRHDSPAVRGAAIEALASIDKDSQATFQLVAKTLNDPNLRDAAVRTLLSISVDDRDPKAAGSILDLLVKHAETTPAEDRTSNEFIDAMQLADQLLAMVPAQQSRGYRERLREVTVRLIRIRTVEEEMRYDLPYFAVQAGSSVQVVLQNEDLMPHNLVVTQPGELQAVAQLGLAVGPTGGWQGKQYVPESDKVLFATDMVQPHQQYRLTFDAPAEPGEYPYVCTFPQHWYRMYGVMVVVEDLDAWLQNPVEPANPIGSNRSFVQAWKVDDFAADLETGMRGRSFEIGKRLFEEASCLGCHRVEQDGGIIGPDLDEVFTRWKGDTKSVLREILEPAHKIDDKYAMHLVLTADGQTISGIVIEETDDAVTVLSSPDAKEPTVIPLDDIAEMVKSPTSMMPKALLDQYTKDEIFELLAYLKYLGNIQAADEQANSSGE